MTRSSVVACACLLACGKPSPTATTTVAASASSSATPVASIAPVTRTVSGTVAGAAFESKDAISSYKHGMIVFAGLTIATFVDACANVKSPSGPTVKLAFTRMSGAIAPGTYELTRAMSPMSVEANFYGPKGALVESATRGTVTIEAISATSIRGTLDLVFAHGSVKGAFDAPACANY